MTFTSYRPVTIVGGHGVPEVRFFNDGPLALIAGPCQLETLDHALRTAEAIKKMTDLIGMPFVFKSSYDKANRTSGTSRRGPGLVEGLRILEKVRNTIGVPVTTDVHSPDDAYTVSMTVDLIQVPALLSRQTDLLHEAGRHGRAVSVKKGQFMAAVDTEHVVRKVINGGGAMNDPLLIERGSSWGPDRLVVDMSGLEVMKSYAPVVFDATHSVQYPGGQGVADVSGGNRRMVEPLARAAVAVGIAGVFIECHEDPDNAPSDGPCMVPLTALANLLLKLQEIDVAAKD